MKDILLIGKMQSYVSSNAKKPNGIWDVATFDFGPLLLLDAA